MTENNEELNLDFIQVASIDEIPDGERLFIEIDDEPIVIFNVKNTFYAISDTCTHDDGTLGDGDLDGYEIICPRHGARFDIRTGKVLTLPASKNIPIFPVRIKDDLLEIGIPLEE